MDLDIQLLRYPIVRKMEILMAKKDSCGRNTAGFQIVFKTKAKFFTVTYDASPVFKPFNSIPLLTIYSFSAALLAIS